MTEDCNCIDSEFLRYLECCNVLKILETIRDTKNICKYDTLEELIREAKEKHSKHSTS